MSSRRALGHALTALGAAGAACSCWLVAAGAWRLHRRALARRRLRELLEEAAGSDARIVVTGADSGIGAELAHLFARHPKVSLILGCRDEDSAKQRYLRERRRGSKDHGPSEKLRVETLELLDLDSVQRFSDHVHRFLAAGSDGLRLLVNAAGVMAPAGARTETGVGVTWQTNFLGPFLLTELLARQREAVGAQQALRVVHLNSSMEQSSRLNSTTPELDEPLLDEVGSLDSPGPHGAYADSKRAVLLWLSVRAQSLAFKANMFSHATMPGRVDTPLRKDSVPTWWWLLSKPVRALFLQTPSEGALASVAMGLHPQATERFGRCGVGEEQVEDLVVERMPEKRLAVKLVKWATQATQLESRAAASLRRSAVDEAIASRARARM